VKKSLYKSPTGIVGIRFQRKVLKAGTYKFFCSLHSTEMRMKVIVKNR
jgi:plastocyanin